MLSNIPFKPLKKKSTSLSDSESNVKELSHFTKKNQKNQIRHLHPLPDSTSPWKYVYNKYISIHPSILPKWEEKIHKNSKNQRGHTKIQAQDFFFFEKKKRGHKSLSTKNFNNNNNPLVAHFHSPLILSDQETSQRINKDDLSD